MRWSRLGPLLLGGAILSQTASLGCESEPETAGPREDDAVSSPAECDADFLPRQLRLLTRREYNATVRALLPFGGPSTGAGAACSADTSCDIQHESCVGGSCQRDACTLSTFYFPAQGQTFGSVVVAGSFNAWASTAAEGGFPLTYLSDVDAWVAKRPLEVGTYQYKLVLDGQTWIADPENPSTVPDGFGGVNSELEVTCDEGASDPAPPPASDAAEDPAAKFPVESRPEGYPFDNSAEGGLVTSVHVEQYLRAAEELGAVATAHADELAACEHGEEASACARRFVERFGRRAFRRPLAADEVEKYLTLASSLPGEPTSGAGLGLVVRAMLSSPFFLYRSEVGEEQYGALTLTAYELASALSYTLWGTMPDDALLDAAERGELTEPAQIEAQARRLLADERSRPLLAEFAAQWLGVEDIARLDKSPGMFPTWDDALAAAVEDETRRFVTHVVFDSTGTYDELLTADYSVASAEVAALYGVEAATDGVTTLPEARAAGLLGQASVLAQYAHSDQTSPIRRGLFVRRNLLCQKFGAPPPEAGGVPDVDPDATTRERFSQHSSDPACSVCHENIDPIGFGFETFDAIGAFRTEENGQPIDATGEIKSLEGFGTDSDVAFASLPELGHALAESASARACFVLQSYRFAKGGLETPDDACSIEGLTARFAATGFDIQELLVEITKMPSFRRRK